jgi:hypothetical protein
MHRYNKKKMGQLDFDVDVAVLQEPGHPEPECYFQNGVGHQAAIHAELIS